MIDIYRYIFLCHSHVTQTYPQVKTEESLPPLMLHSSSPTANKLFANDDMYSHIHGSLVIGKDSVTLKPASEQLVESYENIR